jgi:hypothetical protein
MTGSGTWARHRTPYRQHAASITLPARDRRRQPLRRHATGLRDAPQARRTTGKTAQADALPPSFHCSSQFYVDRFMDYLDADPAATTVLRLAFTARWPLRPEAAIARYAGRYDAGYD